MTCSFCPRYCKVDRDGGERGFCGAGSLPAVSLADLHHWEEPCISGDRGSGAVFFTRCNLRCVFCQNHSISQGAEADAPEATPEELAGIFLSLQRKGAHNVNLVSPTHLVGPVAAAMRIARERGFALPFVYNTNGYDSKEGLAMLDGLVDVYLPDLKYVSGKLSTRYSAAPDYFKHASAALIEMARQVGAPQLEDGIIRRGLIVRHLVLPGCAEDSIACLRWISDNLPEGTYVSVMSQYYPCHKASLFPEINRRLTQREYDKVVEEVYALGLDGYVQDLESASPDYTPDFGRNKDQSGF